MYTDILYIIYIQGNLKSYKNKPINYIIDNVYKMLFQVQLNIQISYKTLLLGF